MAAIQSLTLQSHFYTNTGDTNSPTWRTFLEQHVRDLVSIDFFVVATLRFRVLFVFIVFAHDRRRIVHFNVTEHPTARWTAQQIVEAFPFAMSPRYLIRDGEYTTSGLHGGLRVWASTRSSRHPRRHGKTLMWSE